MNGVGLKEALAGTRALGNLHSRRTGARSRGNWPADDFAAKDQQFALSGAGKDLVLQTNGGGFPSPRDFGVRHCEGRP